MSPTMTRGDDLDIRLRLAEYGMGIRTSFSDSPSGIELSVEVSGADRVIHRGPLLERTPSELPLEEHTAGESVLTVSRDGKLATVLAGDLDRRDSMRLQLPVDATHLVLYSEAYEEVGAKTTYVEIYSPIY